MTLPFNPERIAYACYLCGSVREVRDLAEAASRSSVGGGFVQLFANREEIRKRLLQAYLSSLVRRREGMMRSKSIDKEMFLMLSDEQNISRAIERFGATDAGDFILFASDSKTASSFIRSQKIRVKKRYRLTLS